MGYNKKISIMLIILVALTIPVVIYLNSLYFLVFNPIFYSLGFEKNKVYNRYPDKTIPDLTAKQLIDYFKNNKKDLPEIELFDENEKQHLYDVKVLIKQSIGIYFCSLFILVLLTLLLYRQSKRRFRKKITKSLKLGSFLTISITILFIFSLIKFEWFFEQFHYLFFPQGNWTFPYDSNLIMLFPGSFFLDGFIIFLVINFLQSFLLLKIRAKMASYFQFRKLSF